MNPQFKDDFLGVWLCSPVQTDRYREDKTFFFLILDQYCHEHANTCVCYQSSQRSTIHMLGFFSHFDYLYWPTNSVCVGTEPWKIKADRNCPVMCVCAFIFQLFKLSFCWNSPLQLCGYFKYFILLNLLSESRLLSSKYHFHMNINFFFLFVGILTLLCRMKYSPFLCSCNVLHQFPKDNNLLYSHFIRINYTQRKLSNSKQKRKPDVAELFSQCYLQTNI